MVRLLAIPIIGAALAFTPAPHQPPPAPERLEADVFQAANEFREQNRLPALRRNAVLTEDARAYAEYLLRTGKFSHTADGREPSERARAAGYEYCNIDENLAYEEDNEDFGEERVSHIFMSGWEASPGHRRNLLDREVTETGIGVARALGGVRKYVAVQEFGRPISERFSFRVVNDADWSISYAYDGQNRTIPARAIITEITCSHGELAFPRGGSGQSRYAAEPGTSYVLEPALGGVSVDIVRSRGGEGRTDRN